MNTRLVWKGVLVAIFLGFFIYVIFTTQGVPIAERRALERMLFWVVVAFFISVVVFIIELIELFLKPRK